MRMSRKWRLCVFVLSVACLVPSLFAEIRETRVYHGKKVQCIHGGNYLNPIQTCGTQFYARVFTGTVKSIVDISDTDKRLVLIPDEVFVGPASEVTATVNQACMPLNEPEIQSGDKWVFYLRSPGFSPNDTTVRELSVPYDSPSKPLSQGQDDIAMLWHLARLTDKGILTGNVERIGEAYDNLNPTPVANLKIVAKSVSNGAEYGAVTNRNGVKSSFSRFAITKSPRLLAALTYKRRNLLGDRWTSASATAARKLDRSPQKQSDRP